MIRTSKYHVSNPPECHTRHEARRLACGDLNQSTVCRLVLPYQLEHTPAKRRAAIYRRLALTTSVETESEGSTPLISPASKPEDQALAYRQVRMDKATRATSAGGTRHVELWPITRVVLINDPLKVLNGSGTRSPRAHERATSLRSCEFGANHSFKFVRTVLFSILGFTAFLYPFKIIWISLSDQKKLSRVLSLCRVAVSIIVEVLPYLTSTTRVTSLSSTLISVGSPPRECPQLPPSMVGLGSEAEASRAMYVRITKSEMN